MGLEKIHCNSCGKKTRHAVRGSHKVEKFAKNFPLSWYDEYSIVECQGCEEIHFRERFWFSEDQSSDPDDEPVFRDSFFPPREFRLKPEWFEKLPLSLSGVLTEVYVALQNGLRYLAAVGARTALDLILIEKVTDCGGFITKLKKLESQGFVTADERELLEAVTEAGNAAAHRGYSPLPEDLVLVMDILERIIEKLYFQEEKNKELKEAAKSFRERIPLRS